MERLNELYEAKDIVFLTNSLGEETDSEPVPEYPYEWYENLALSTNALLYLVKLHGVFGVLGIYEFGEYYCNEVFHGDMDLMHDHLKSMRDQLQNRLKNIYSVSRKYPVLYGEESGFEECDEIAIFVPVDHDHEEIVKTFLIADEICEGGN